MWRRSSGSRRATRSRSCASSRRVEGGASRVPTWRRPRARAASAWSLIGVAQEKTSAWRGWREGGPDGHPHFDFGRQSVFVNHYYFYVRDREWGPAFVKTCAYAPYPLWLCLNGHEWAKRQAEKAGIAFEALDNGFRSTADADALAAICARLSERARVGVLPPLRAAAAVAVHAEDRAAAAIATSSRSASSSSPTPASSTAPQAGRAWFERMIRDQLALGRPDHVSIVFGRKVIATTPGRFQTRVINRGVEPAIQAHYKHSKVKQYFKEGRALRTETTVNDPYDFGVGRLLTARQLEGAAPLGHDINERLLDAQLQACACAPDPDDARTRRPAVHPRRPTRPRPALRRPARDGAARRALLPSRTCSTALTNRSLRELIAGLIPGYTPRQMTYDLRRLRRKGLIRRVPALPPLRAHRPRPPDRRLLHQDLHAHRQPSLAELDPPLPDAIAAPLTARTLLARLRTRARRPHHRRRHRGLKR